jgi:hypothetical protein
LPAHDLLTVVVLGNSRQGFYPTFWPVGFTPVVGYLSGQQRMRLLIYYFPAFRYGIYNHIKV